MNDFDLFITLKWTGKTLDAKYRFGPGLEKIALENRGFLPGLNSLVTQVLSPVVERPSLYTAEEIAAGLREAVAGHLQEGGFDSIVEVGWLQ